MCERRGPDPESQRGLLGVLEVPHVLSCVIAIHTWDQSHDLYEMPPTPWRLLFVLLWRNLCLRDSSSC